MPVTLERLAVDLVANGSKLRAEYKKSSKAGQSWAKKTRAAVTSTTKALFKTAAITAGALTAVYVQNARLLDGVAKTSDKLGELPENLIGLQHAADITGVSIEKTNMGLQRMVRRVAEAARGTGEAQGAIKELGLDAARLAQMTPTQQFREFAGAMEGVKNQGDRVRIAMKLFDSEGVALVNTLALGRDGLAEMQQEAEDLGLTVSRVNLAKIEAANDSFARARGATGAFGRQLSAELAPIVGGVAMLFTETAKEAGGLGTVASNVVDTLVTGFGYVADTVHGVRVVWKGLTALVAKGVSSWLNHLATVEGALRSLVDLIPGVELAQGGFIQGVAESFKLTADEIAQEFNELALSEMPSERVKAWVNDVRDKFQVEAERVAADRKNMLGQALTGIDLEDPTGTLAAQNEKVISLQQEKFKRLREAALQANNQHRALERLRYQEQLADLEKQKALLVERGLLTATIEDQFRQAKLDAEQVHQEKLADIKQQELEKEEEIAAAKRKVYSDLAGVVAASAKEGSKAQRAALAIQKTIALRESLIAMNAAIQKAREIGWPANIPIIADTTLAALQTHQNIKGVSVGGIAHAGLTSVPREQTMLVDRGERIIKRNQNEDLTQFLKNAKPGYTVNVYNYSGQDVQTRQRGEALDVVVGQAKGSMRQDLRSGQGISRDLEQIYGLTRRGVV